MRCYIRECNENPKNDVLSPAIVKANRQFFNNWKERYVKPSEYKKLWQNHIPVFFCTKREMTMTHTRWRYVYSDGTVGYSKNKDWIYISGIVLPKPICFLTQLIWKMRGINGTFSGLLRGIFL